MAQKTAKKTKKEPKARTQQAVRKVKTPRYQSFRLQPKIQVEVPKLASGRRLLKESLVLVSRHWKLFLGIVTVIAAVHLVLVQSFSNIDLTDAKQALESIKQGNVGQLLSGLSLFAYLMGTAGSANSEAAGVYRFIILLVVSLALIWAVRHIVGGKKVGVRDSFYNGMYPIVPFVLVLAVIGLQFLPLGFGAYLYSLTSTAGVTVGGTEWLLWGAAVFLLTLVTFYMVTSSIFALYIVCLPGMRPIAALRSAREIVRFRRWVVMRRILFLPLVVVVGGALIMVPVILFATPLAVWVFFILGMLLLPVAHSYMYKLYWELLREDS